MDSEEFDEMPATPGGSTPLQDEPEYANFDADLLDEPQGESTVSGLDGAGWQEDNVVGGGEDFSMEYNPGEPDLIQGQFAADLGGLMDAQPTGETDFDPSRGAAGMGDVMSQFDTEAESERPEAGGSEPFGLEMAMSHHGQDAPADADMESPANSPQGDGLASPQDSAGPRSPDGNPESPDNQSLLSPRSASQSVESGSPRSAHGDGPYSPDSMGAEIPAEPDSPDVDHEFEGAPQSPLELTEYAQSPQKESEIPEGPVSPVEDSDFQEAAVYGEDPASPDLDRLGSQMESPFGHPGSPSGSVGPVSPAAEARSRSPSPGGSQEPASPGSPMTAGGYAGSQSPTSDQGLASPASLGSGQSGSPIGSAGSHSPSPGPMAPGSPVNGAGSIGSRSPRSRGSRSRSASPAIIGSPRSPSPAWSGSRSRSGSPHSPSPARSDSRSRNGSPRSPGSARSGSRSRSGSPHSPGSARSGSRSRSGSPRSPGSARSGSRSRSGSPHSPSPARSGSPHSMAGSEPPSGPSSPRTGERGVSRAEKGSDEEESDKESVVGELIADIFGSSDEEEEFEGFGEADVAKSGKSSEKQATVSDDEDAPEAAATATGEVLPDLSSDEEVDSEVRKDRGDFVSDFDLMLERKKAERSAVRRRRKNVDIINDSDDLISDLLQKMKQAAEEDRELNQQKKPAVRKMKMLPLVASQLRKSDLHIAFLDCGALNAITEWLAPLPDKSLPHLKIREVLLRQLNDFPPINTELLKNSGIGKAVMYLYKHPKEIKEHKIVAGKLINEWSRPIFNLTSDFKSLTREDREQRDYEQLPKKRRLSVEGAATPRRDIQRALAGQEKALRPGDPGFVQRARVPQPSTKDYVVRPKWQVEEAVKRVSKKALNRYEKRMKEYKQKQMQKKASKAISISLEGRNMPL